MLTWKTRIDRARARYKRPGRKVGFTSRDFIDAGGWETCACGRLDPRILPRLDRAPRDDQLWRLGCASHDSVRGDYFDLADIQLAKIDARAAVVLAQVAEKGPT